jgi:hypothetical protein
MCSVRYVTDKQILACLLEIAAERVTRDFLQQFADRHRLAANQTYFVGATDQMTSSSESPSRFLLCYNPTVFCVTVTSEANDNDDRYVDENGAREYGLGLEKIDLYNALVYGKELVCALSGF